MHRSLAVVISVLVLTTTAAPALQAAETVWSGLVMADNVSQPQPLSQGQTTVTPDQKVKAQEQKSNFVTLGKNATVEDLIRALNSLGVTPRDTIAILEALKSAGALQAELEII